MSQFTHFLEKLNNFGAEVAKFCKFMVYGVLKLGHQAVVTRFRHLVKVYSQPRYPVSSIGGHRGMPPDFEKMGKTCGGSEKIMKRAGVGKQGRKLKKKAKNGRKT